MNPTIALRELYRPIEAPMAAVHEQMNDIWRDALSLAPMDCAQTIITPVGGKMLRPALCLLAAGAIGAHDLQPYVPCAAAFEALHIASLAHDDVIDHALLRRGAASLNGMWDNHAAVLGGDYLVARAVEALCEYDCCAIVANAVSTVRRMAEGELHFFGRDPKTITEQDCILLARQKTASLFAEACSAPSFLIDSAQHQHLHRYGTSLGIAFQIVDDVLDITQTAEGLGKPACGDVAEDKATLPIIYLREALNEADRAHFERLRGQALSEADRAWIGDAARDTGATERGAAVAREYLDNALAALGELPPSAYRDSMEGIADFVQIRTA